MSSSPYWYALDDIMRLALAPVLVTLLASSAVADVNVVPVSSVEWHQSVDESLLTQPFDIFCLERPGFRVKVPRDAVEHFGDASKGQVPVRVYNMSMVECPHGWDIHQMGHQFFAGGSSQWVVVYAEHYIVRVYGFGADIRYDDAGKPVLIVHGRFNQCQAGEYACDAAMPLPMFMQHE
jgi:hypothetical protein